ncbi:MAG: Rpn family recombination-promoting nuclease/putative transposase [Clostridia bacterium]|nr:Rpn family recombination-promoting nuclease/putative transposase [Clostridia bacterium]
MPKLKIKETDISNLLPTNDYLFKKLFGRKGSEKLTESLIQNFIGIKDIEVEEVYEDVILEKDLYQDKLGILDVQAKTKNNEYINIEMQCGNYEYIKDRLVFYLCKSFGMEAIRAGEDYSLTRRTVAVLICKDKLEILKEIPKWKTTWHIREDEYRTKVLTNKIEVVIIELEKITEMIYKGKIKKGSPEYVWNKFFLNPKELEEKEMKENKYVKEAQTKYVELIDDYAEARLALSRQMARMEKNTLRNLGIKEGIKQGIEQGLEEGIEKGKIEIAKNLLKMGISIEQISEATGLTIEEIKKYNKNT